MKKVFECFLSRSLEIFTDIKKTHKYYQHAFWQENEKL